MTPSPSTDRPFLPTLGQGLVLWLLYLVASNLGGMFAGGVERSWPGSTLAIASAAALLAAPPLSVVWLGKRLSGRTWSAVLPVRLPRPWTSLLVVASVAGLELAVLGLLVSMADLLPRGGPPLEAVLESAPVLKAVLIAPLTEEAMFRGLLLGGFLLAYRRWTAILLSAVLFAAVHLHPVQAGSTLATGIFLSWLMAESRNLFLPLVGHAVANGVVLAVAHSPAVAGPLLRRPVTHGILGLFVLALGTFLLRRTLRPGPRPSLTTGEA